MWTVFPSGAHFTNCAAFFQVSDIFSSVTYFCKCGAVFKVWRLSPSVGYFSQCSAFFQEIRILPTVPVFFKCGTFFKVQRIFASVAQFSKCGVFPSLGHFYKHSAQQWHARFRASSPKIKPHFIFRLAKQPRPPYAQRDFHQFWVDFQQLGEYFSILGTLNKLVMAFIFIEIKRAKLFKRFVSSFQAEIQPHFILRLIEQLRPPYAHRDFDQLWLFLPELGGYFPVPGTLN